MKITKFLHSCLLVKENNLTILIDPGNYTAEENALDLNKIENIDYLLITHEHPDHCYIPLIKSIVEKFPDIKIITNKSVSAILANENIRCQTAGNDNITLTPTPHEDILKTPPENTLFKIFDKLIHPGDSQSFTPTADIIALPMQAPWGSYFTSIKLTLKLKPKYILPIHDFHWKDDFRKMMYDRTEKMLTDYGIVFEKMETGVEIEI